MFRKQIISALAKATNLSAPEIHLEFPESTDHGDYSSNIAMAMFSNSQFPIPNSQFKSPRELAEWIKNKLAVDSSLKSVVDKVEVAGPGFINFWLKSDVLLSNLIQIGKQKGKYGMSAASNRGERIMFEFGQPNTHKIPHIGHLFSYVYGEAMCRILIAAGNSVHRANYQGDVGLHVAKCLWAYQKDNPKDPKTLEEKVALLQKLYQTGSKAYDESAPAKEEIQQLNKKIYEMDESIKPLWEKTRRWSIEYYKEFEKRLGVKYDRYYFESEVYGKGREIVEKNIGKVFKKSEGAVIFEGSKYGLHDRVFLTKYSTPTYEAKDMYLQQLKMEEWPADLLVITTANEQNAYFDVIFKALEVLSPAFAGKLKHVGFGMVNLKGGKMSSRTGEIVGAVELVNMTVAAIQKIIADRKDLDEAQKREIAEVVGTGAVKYSFLKNNPLQNTAFDLEESIATDGNSGSYLQYTHARCKSVLVKALGRSKLGNSKKGRPVPSAYPLVPEEYAVLRGLARFPETIVAVAENYSPNLLCEYLFDLAQKYNGYYNQHKIIGSETQEFRLQLTECVAQVLSNGLNLLGIQAPEKM